MIYILIAELSAAVALPLGLWTRWVNLFAFPLTAGAAHHWLDRTGFWFSGAGGEFPLLWAAALRSSPMNFFDRAARVRRQKAKDAGFRPWRGDTRLQEGDSR
jgi:hypothetical protein